MKKAKKVVAGIIMSLFLLGIGGGIASAAEAHYFIGGKEVSETQFESHLKWLMDNYPFYCNA